MYPFFAIKQSLYQYLTGSVEQSAQGTNSTSQISLTDLMKPDSWATSDLFTQLPGLMENLTISTLVVSNVTAETNCTITVVENIYLYQPGVLIIVYSSAVAVGLAGLFVGVTAAWGNGIPTGSLFSQLLVTVSFHRTLHLYEPISDRCLSLSSERHATLSWMSYAKGTV